MSELKISSKKNMEHLVEVIQQLSLAQDLQSVIEIVRHAARELTGADGATFILRDEDRCYYVDEDSIAPLWKGLKFPMSACISGWCMMHRESVAITNIYEDPRIPADAYRPTFVKSLVVVPIRRPSPIGAIGNYWADTHQATPEEIDVLQSLADSTSIALKNLELISHLEKQLTLRDEFVLIAAHELKTPLTTLSIRFQHLARLLKSENFDLAKQQTRAKNLLDSCHLKIQDFGFLIDSLLDVSRLRLGRLAYQFENTDLGELTQRILQEFDETVLGRIQCNLASNIAGNWDQLKLSQVIRNLLSNAIKYGKSKPIRISLTRNENAALLSIEDHGLGIAPEDRSRIFERFERGVSADNFGGLGLGLYISSEIIKAHQGKIHLKSSLGQGSCFTLELPLTVRV